MKLKQLAILRSGEQNSFESKPQFIMETIKKGPRRNRGRLPKLTAYEKKLN